MGPGRRGLPKTINYLSIKGAGGGEAGGGIGGGGGGDGGGTGYG